MIHMRKKNTIEICNELAAAKNGSCLSAEYLNAKSPLKWKCEFGHIWTAPYARIHQGKWCPECAGKTITISTCKAVALEKKGKCLSPEYKGGKVKLKWACEFDHEFWAEPRHILNSKSWCPTCAGRVTDQRSREIKLEKMRALAKDRKGILISEEYVSAKSKYTWRCALGHEFQASWNLVSRATWCPKCSNLSNNTENQVRQIFEAIFEGYKFPNVRPDFLKTTQNGRLEIDGYCKELALAFEYDGPQHFQVTRFSSPKQLKEIQERDKKKEQILNDRGIFLIRINCFEDLSLLSSRLKNLIKENRPDLTNHKFDINFEMVTPHMPAHYLERLAQIAEKSGGKLISKAYLGEKVKLKFRCSEGHEWEAAPTNILRGKWCRKCSHAKRVSSRKDFLSWELICQIRQIYAEGKVTYTELGERFGVSRVTVSNIVNNRTRLKF